MLWRSHFGALNLPISLSMLYTAHRMSCAAQQVVYLSRRYFEGRCGLQSVPCAEYHPAGSYSTFIRYQTVDQYFATSGPICLVYLQFVPPARSILDKAGRRFSDCSIEPLYSDSFSSHLDENPSMAAAVAVPPPSASVSGPRIDLNSSHQGPVKPGSACRICKGAARRHSGSRPHTTIVMAVVIASPMNIR